MPSHSPSPTEIDLTGLLNRGLAGDSLANERAFAQVYAELRRSAKRQMRHGDAPTLSPTSLVNEVYLKLAEGMPREVANRAHFFSMAARAMRQVLIDHQRGSRAIKRGGDQKRVELGEEAFNAFDAFAAADERIDYLALEQAIDALARIDARAALVVNWHFFSGLNFLEIAELLGISDKTARRDWDSARAFLLSRL